MRLELIEEISVLKQRIQELEKSEAEHRLAGDALRASEEKYRTIMANIEDGYYEVDINGNFTFFNESMCKILGYEAEEMVGMNNRQYADEENSRKVYQIYNRVYRTGEPVKNFEWQIIQKDGTRRDNEVSISLISNAEGHTTGFRGIVRDTTERKRTEEALKESERNFRRIFDQSPIATAIAIDGHFARVNRAMCSMLGYTEEEFASLGFADITHPDHLDTDREQVKRLISGEIDEYITEKNIFIKMAAFFGDNCL
jgi:PAS domain S-box-containing protein